MCGLSGVWSTATQEERTAAIDRMCKSLEARGPDDAGTWASSCVPLALGHRRLSVLDLSKAGAQPMVSTSGRTVIAFNGEIYNHGELRTVLADQGVRFKGYSDTEVAVEAIERWGLERALSKFVGMFALAVWFVEQRQLCLIRDRFGVKPLYYKYVPGRKLIFASQLQAFEAIGETGDISTDSLSSYLQYGYVPGATSIYEGIERLAPGTCVTFRSDGHGRPVCEASRRYWRLPEVSAVSEIQEDPSTVAERVEGLVEESVRLRLIADVPVGIFLSGGIDSALVAATARKLGVRDLRTFTIGFSEPGWPDETERAESIAKHLESIHTSWIPTSEDIRQTANALPCILDEPFADPSIIPTCLVSQLARRDVTVALSGDGGDEGFLGYDRYSFAPKALRRYGWLGGRAASWMVPTIDCLASSIDPLSRRWARRLSAAASLARASGDAKQFYDWSVAARAGDQYLAQERRISASPPSSLGETATLRALNRYDIEHYLPDDILYKVDRASMAVSLEAREPLLDHNLVEYGWRLSAERKVDQCGTGKLPLRAALGKILPADLLEGPKRGFGAPVGEWMRGPLRRWRDRYLDCEDPYLDGRLVKQLTTIHHASGGKPTSDTMLWRALMFRAWWAERST